MTAGIAEIVRALDEDPDVGLFPPATKDEIQEALLSLAWEDAPLDLRALWGYANGICYDTEAIYGVYSPNVFFVPIERATSDHIVPENAKWQDYLKDIVIVGRIAPHQYLGVERVTPHRVVIMFSDCSYEFFSSSIVEMIIGWYRLVSGRDLKISGIG